MSSSTKRENDMTNLLGPHEGIEFKLLDAGEKYVAFFCEIIPDQFYSFQRDPEYGSFEWVKGTPAKGAMIDISYAILFRKSHEKQATRLKSLVQSAQFSFETEREIGEILSYSNEAIDYYLDRVKRKNYFS